MTTVQTDHSRLARYEAQLRDLEAKRNDLMRCGQYLRSVRLNADIAEVRRLLDEAKKHRSQPLREMLSREQIDSSGIIDKILECHMAADFLTDCAYNLKDTLDSLGLVAKSLLPELDEVIRLTDRLSGEFCMSNASLSDMMTSNDTMLAALHKKVLSYIHRNKK